MARLEPLAATSLKKRAAGVIRSAIFSGQFGPGDALRELHLARDLKVSQPTVREALLELEAEGLVIRTPNVGTSVTNMRTEEVRERLSLRETLETIAMVEAAPRIGRSERAELKRRLDQLSATVEAQPHFEWALADLEFHQCIWDCSGNRTLARTLRQISAPVFAFASLLRSTGAKRPGRAQNPHIPLIKALESGNEDQMRNAVRDHLANSYDEFLLSGAEHCRAFVKGGGKTRAAG